MTSKRPVYLNLFAIKLPLPGLVSILHRISGALLFLCLPFLLLLLQQSLGSEAGFAEARESLGHPLGKLALIVLLWAYIHHFLAGLRFLALDLDIGAELRDARLLSKLVLVLSVGLALLVAGGLW